MTDEQKTALKLKIGEYLPSGTGAINGLAIRNALYQMVDDFDVDADTLQAAIDSKRFRLEQWIAGPWKMGEFAVSADKRKIFTPKADIANSQTEPSADNTYWKLVLESAVELDICAFAAYTAADDVQDADVLVFQQNSGTKRKMSWSWLWGKVNTALALKVDKAAGKQLSTEDFTTAEKTKLAGLSTTGGGTTETTFAAALKFDKSYKTTRNAAAADALTLASSPAPVYHNRHTIYYAAGSAKPTFSASFVALWDNWKQDAAGGNIVTCIYLPSGKVGYDIRYY